MSKSKLVTVFKTVQKTVSKHSPEILTGLGIAGMVTTTVLAVRATPKALRLLEEAEHSKGEDLTVSETVKACWKPYIPAAVTGVASIACLVGASSVSARRNAALATAYKLSETALSDYKEKVVETIGEEKEKVVREAVAKKQIERKSVKEADIINTGNGDTLFCDLFCGRFFKSDRNYIERVVNILNRRMRTEMYISLNEFYRELGLDDVEVGDYIGWNIDKGYIELDFGSDLLNEDTPYVTIHHTTVPNYNFDKF